MIWLSAVIKGVVASIAAILQTLWQYLGYIFAFRLGKKKAEQKMERASHAVTEKQLDIAARPPEHRRDILERMHKNNL